MKMNYVELNFFLFLAACGGEKSSEEETAAETVTETETETETQTETDTQTETVTETETDTDSETDTGTETLTETETDNCADATEIWSSTVVADDILSEAGCWSMSSDYTGNGDVPSGAHSWSINEPLPTHDWWSSWSWEYEVDANGVATKPLCKSSEMPPTIH